ncbi:hypothetical protein DJ73_10045 [Halorubrum sp. Ea1]|uniref:hypothetical protein n=1 Tax=Halorubrum sp. Ea1 TaxID=1480718 RepID=UPI000B999AF0|nr:hypothetical protein [Halorubrum sp. Ea1]OYR52771.1 hypothetical protein DJ73_10045 [Halorubrum sp. Ea1]
MTDDTDADDAADVADGMPHDVRAALTQLLDRAGWAAKTGDTETAVALLDTAETVAANKLPLGDRRDRLRHGCRAARAALPDGDLAAAYADAAAARLPDG